MRPRLYVNRFTLQTLADELGVQVAFVEKDFVLSQVVYHYAHSELAEQFILKGGQALRHIYRSPRLSKDVDFVATRRIEFGDLPSLMEIRYRGCACRPLPQGARGALVAAAILVPMVVAGELFAAISRRRARD